MVSVVNVCVVFMCMVCFFMGVLMGMPPEKSFFNVLVVVLMVQVIMTMPMLVGQLYVCVCVSMVLFVLDV